MSEAIRPTTCKACCPSCGLHFAGQEAFDRHLGGPGNDWAHHHPLDVTNRQGDPLYDRERGLCRMVPADEREVWIWYLHERRARARAQFDRQPALGRGGVESGAFSPTTGGIAA